MTQIAIQPRVEELAKTLCAAYWADNWPADRVNNAWDNLRTIGKGQWRRAARAACRELLGVSE